MVESGDTGEAPEPTLAIGSLASLGSLGPKDKLGPDLEICAMWVMYSRRRDRERFESRNVANRIFGVPRERWAVWRGQ